jgi:collagen type VII alpha
MGAIGSQGVAGVTGAAGSTGAVGATGPPISFQGIWSSLTDYATGDAVFYSGSSYISLSGGNLNHTPTGGVPWALLAQQGTTGATGATGATGPTGANGTNGTNGTNGSNGATGATGPAGGQTMLIASYYNTGVPGFNFPPLLVHSRALRLTQQWRCPALPP